MTDKQLTQRLLEAALIEDVAYPAGLEERLTASLDSKRTKVTPVASTPAASKTIPVVRWASAAAVALLVVVSTAIGILSTSEPSFANQPIFANTCSTPDEARAELQSALAMLQPTTNNGDLLNLLN